VIAGVALLRDGAGRGDRGRSVRPGGSRDGEVAHGEFRHTGRGRQVLDLMILQAHDQLAADHADSGGDGAVVAHGLLDLAGHPQVVGVRQAVRDDGALQRHHREAVTAGPGHMLAVPDAEAAQRPRGIGHDRHVTALPRAVVVGPARREVSDLLVGGSAAQAGGHVAGRIKRLSE